MKRTHTAIALVALAVLVLLFMAGTLVQSRLGGPCTDGVGVHPDDCPNEHVSGPPLP